MQRPRGCENLNRLSQEHFMRRKVSSCVVTLTLSGWGCLGTAFCSTIDIFNTGESGSGTAMAIGETDPHFSLVSAPAGVPLAAVTTSTDPLWINNTPTADWISPGSDGTTYWAPGTYDFQVSFDLTG